MSSKSAGNKTTKTPTWGCLSQNLLLPHVPQWVILCNMAEKSPFSLKTVSVPGGLAEQGGRKAQQIWACCGPQRALFQKCNKKVPKKLPVDRMGHPKMTQNVQIETLNQALFPTACSQRASRFVGTAMQLGNLQDPIFAVKTRKTKKPISQSKNFRGARITSNSVCTFIQTGLSSNSDTGSNWGGPNTPNNPIAQASGRFLGHWIQCKTLKTPRQQDIHVEKIWTLQNFAFFAWDSRNK